MLDMNRLFCFNAVEKSENKFLQSPKAEIQNELNVPFLFFWIPDSGVLMFIGYDLSLNPFFLLRSPGLSYLKKSRHPATGLQPLILSFTVNSF